MTQQPGAKVKSSDAIEAFRARLITYLTKVRPVLDHAQDEVVRSREWIRSERKLFWENEYKRRKRTLEDAQQALFAAEFSNLRETTSAELLAVERAKRALSEAEEKLRVVKRWNLEFEHRVMPLLKHLEQLQTTLVNELPKGVEYLRQIIAAIDRYADAITPKPEEQKVDPAEPVPPEVKP